MRTSDKVEIVSETEDLRERLKCAEAEAESLRELCIDMLRVLDRMLAYVDNAALDIDLPMHEVMTAVTVHKAATTAIARARALGIGADGEGTK